MTERKATTVTKNQQKKQRKYNTIRRSSLTFDMLFPDPEGTIIKVDDEKEVTTEIEGGKENDER